MSLYSQIISHNSLLLGFNKVQESDGAAGIDKITISDFEADLENQINRLNDELKHFSYIPQPVIFFERQKKDGKKRLLSIFCVRDRTAQSAAMIVLNPIFEAEYEKESFGFRKGISREDAAREIYRLYKEGYKWVLDADIKDYFDSVDHELLFKRLELFIKEPQVIRLIKKWVECECLFGKQKKKVKSGLLQGSVISPMLANIYLDKFDESIKGGGFKLVRYADDFIVLTKEKPDAEKALNLTKDLLAELKLKINESKTSIKNFDEGFKYLGYIFLNTLIVPASAKDTSRPIHNISTKDFSKETIDKIDSITKFKRTAKIRPGEPVEVTADKLKSSELGSAFLKALDEKGETLNDFLRQMQTTSETEPIKQDAEVEQKFLHEDFTDQVEESETVKSVEVVPPPQVTSFKRTLYIQEQGSVLKKESERLLVVKDDLELLEVPLVKIANIIIFGTCSVTPAVIQLCLRKNIPITLLSSRGKYYGSIESTFANNAELEKVQIFRTIDLQFSLNIAKQITAGKIFNKRTILQRHSKQNNNEDIKTIVDELARIMKRAGKSKSIDDLRGFEGVAAAKYFSVFGMLFHKNKGFYTEKFRRTKRPPLDPVNSLLSFGYTMLASNIYSFLRARGLNPYCSYFHATKLGHPALASDMMEEFRFLVDTIVKDVLNHKILKRNDFYFAKEPSSPCYLTNNGRKIFIKQFEIKMHQKVIYPLSGFKVDYRRCLDLQIQQLVQVILGEKEIYEPFKTLL